MKGHYVPERTGTTDLREATKYAQDFYYKLQFKIRNNEPIHEPLFSSLVAEFLKDPGIKKKVSVGQFLNYQKKMERA